MFLVQFMKTSIQKKLHPFYFIAKSEGQQIGIEFCLHLSCETCSCVVGRAFSGLP